MRTVETIKINCFAGLQPGLGVICSKAVCLGWQWLNGCVLFVYLAQPALSAMLTFNAHVPQLPTSPLTKFEAFARPDFGVSVTAVWACGGS